MRRHLQICRTLTGQSESLRYDGESALSNSAEPTPKFHEPRSSVRIQTCPEGQAVRGRSPSKSIRIQQHRQVQAGRKSHIGDPPCARTLVVAHVQTVFSMIAVTSRCVSSPTARNNRSSWNQPEVQASVSTSSPMGINLANVQASSKDLDTISIERRRLCALADV